MSLTLEQLANLSGGELVGDPTLKITGAASLGEAAPGEISFFANRKYVGLLRKTRASAVFVPPDFAEPINATQIRVSNPTKAFEQVVLKFAPKPIIFTPGIHPSAVVDPSGQLGARVSIQPRALVEVGAHIGQRVLIGGHAGIIGHIEIGDNTAIGAQSGIPKSISGGAWWASPAVPLAEAQRQIAWVHRLGKLFARVKEIEKKLGL